MDGSLKTKAHPFQAFVKNGPGGPLFPFRKDIEEIAAPKPHPRIKLGAIPGDPPFLPMDPLTNQYQGRAGLADGLQEGGLLLAFEVPGITAHHPEPGKGGTDVFFRFFKDPLFSPQQIEGKFPVFQDGQKTDNKVKGHIPEWFLTGQKPGAPHQAFRYGDDQGGIQHKGAVFPVPPGPEEIPEGKEDNIFTTGFFQEFKNRVGQALRGYNIQGNP
jgi:hypothetical protein